MAKAAKKEVMTQKEMKAKIEELTDKVEELSHRVYELDKDCYIYFEKLTMWKKRAEKAESKLEEFKKALEVLGLKQVD